MKEKTDLRVWKNEKDLKKCGFKCVGSPFNNMTKLWVGVSPFSTDLYILAYTLKGEEIGTELLDQKTIELIDNAKDKIGIVKGGNKE